MSEDINKKVKQITDMLGQEGGMPDNLMNIINLLVSSAPNTQGKEEGTAKSGQELAVKEDRPMRNDLDENVEMIRKVKKVMDRMSNQSDPRINLLTAIKPFLGNKRQRKISNCIKILNMSTMARMVDEFDKE